MLYTVYILYSDLHKIIYVGYTSNLIERMKSHNYLSEKDWTRSYRPWKVIYSEYFSSKSEALKREKTLKNGKGREWIWNKIKNEYFKHGFISA
jgi:putative endonuclease